LYVIDILLIAQIRPRPVNNFVITIEAKAATHGIILTLCREDGEFHGISMSSPSPAEDGINRKTGRGHARSFSKQLVNILDMDLVATLKMSVMKA